MATDPDTEDGFITKIAEQAHGHPREMYKSLMMSGMLDGAFCRICGDELERLGWGWFHLCPVCDGEAYENRRSPNAER